LLGLWRKFDLAAKIKEVSANCKKTIRRAKRQYEGKLARQQDPRLLNRYFNESSMVRPRIGLLVGKKGEMIIDNKDVAEAHNDHHQTFFRREMLPM
jgi:hypothetical protein